jgi:cytochrome c-type biogenesis protein CcmH
MTLFWIISALLLVVAVLFVVLPLWRSKVTNSVQRDASNLEIFRDQANEMDADQHTLGKRELQARLLEEVKDPAMVKPLTQQSHKVMAIMLAVILPLSAAGLYLKVGNKNALLPQVPGVAAGATGPTSAAIKELEEKVAQNPKDSAGLEQLAGAYLAQERFMDAAKVYNTLTGLHPDNAQLWADFADTLAMASGQNLAGHPTMLINKALEIDPNNPKALALAGSAAMGRADFPAAVENWEKLLSVVKLDPENTRMFQEGIQQARDAMAQGANGSPATSAQAVPRQPAAPEVKPAAAPASSGPERITGTVTLSDALKARVKPDAMVFVVARAVKGPRMPLAVVRVYVKDLPYQFKLDDSNAMAPQMKLSNYDEVVLLARVTVSGDPVARPGDLEGTSVNVKPGTDNVKVNIDQIVK